MNNEVDDFPEYDDTDENRVSKTQVKRECHDLQELGEAMSKLEPAALDKIPMDDKIREAVITIRKMKKGGALKRQIQYVGKLLRNTDHEPIREAYDKVVDHYREDVKQFHKLENWRDRLVEEGDKALGELLEEMPQVDRQHLRQLIRQASKEKQNNKPPKSSREIFKYLRELSGES
ncbi:MAG: ribosome biogenesis factor YjgA [Gammaproteobacteria bacterium]